MVIQWLDSELRKFRQSHPEKSYPRSLAELDRASHPRLREAQLGIEAGRLDGFRYLYTPSSPDAAGRTPSYRLDVRPVRYGAPLTTSFLCVPQGKLWDTQEDRPAEPTDSNAEEGRPHYCMGESKR